MLKIKAYTDIYIYIFLIMERPLYPIYMNFIWLCLDHKIFSLCHWTDICFPDVSSLRTQKVKVWCDQFLIFSTSYMFVHHKSCLFAS